MGTCPTCYGLRRLSSVTMQTFPTASNLSWKQKKQYGFRAFLLLIVAQLLLSIGLIRDYAISERGVENASASALSSVGLIGERVLEKVEIRANEIVDKNKDQFPDTETAMIIHANNDNSNVNNKWEDSTVLPNWFKGYVGFHREQRLLLNETNWRNQRYLIMRCLDIDDRCGGASDRLQSVPLMLLLANMTGRILFIKWSRPAPLEEFLVPPKGGIDIDWTIPDWLDPQFDFETFPNGTGNITRLVARTRSNKRVITKASNQNYDHGSIFYNWVKAKVELPFDRVYRAMWDVLFTPSAPVAALIDQNYKDLSLVPGEYVATHVRTLYMSDKSSNLVMVHTGINCATELKPGWPIYFASDSSNASRSALTYGRSKNATIVARIADTEPLHLDRGIEFLKRTDSWKNLSSSAFYDVFVDLYLLANSRCVTHGKGGYGKWGSLLSYNSSCSKSHHKAGCQWTEPMK
jgi:hypothetical protein